MFLDVIETEMCASMDGPKVANIGNYVQSNLFSERHWPHCTCPAYKFSKRTINFGGHMVPEPCKHIKQAQEKTCGWHGAYFEAQEESGICPRCGGPTVKVKVAV